MKNISLFVCTVEESRTFFPSYRDALGYYKRHREGGIECTRPTRWPLGATRVADNATAIERIVELLSGNEWDSRTASDIADVLRNAGYPIKEPA